MTPEEQYAHTLGELVDAMQRWGVAHPDALIEIEFPEDMADMFIIGTLDFFPGEWLKNDAARECIRYLSEQVPEATIEQFRTICEGMNQASQNAEQN